MFAFNLFQPQVTMVAVPISSGAKVNWCHRPLTGVKIIITIITMMMIIIVIIIKSEVTNLHHHHHHDHYHQV